jgi:hypothetical protein
MGRLRGAARLLPMEIPEFPRMRYSTVTFLARLRGWSASVPLRTATS